MKFSIKNFIDHWPLIIGHSHAKRGFTLVEILVAMAIMAVVGGIGFGGYVNSQKKGKDAERKSDLYHMQTALDLYYNDKGVYPLSDNCKIKGCGSAGDQVCDWGNSSLTDGTTVYVKPVPKDPKPDYSYCYESDGTSYRIFAYLESPGSSAVSGLTQSCGSSTCNFGVASANSDLAGTIVPVLPTSIPATPTPPPAQPNTIADLKLWLKADAITGIADGGSVTNWPDLSGGGSNATPYGKAPQLKTNVVNGKPVVRSGGDTFLRINNFDLSAPGRTFIAVVKGVPRQSYYPWLFSYYRSTGFARVHFRIGFRGTDPNKFNSTYYSRLLNYSPPPVGSSPQVYIMETAATGVSGFAVYTWVFTSGGSSTSASLYLNSVLSETGSANGYLFPWESFSGQVLLFGGYLSSDSPTASIDADLAELVIYGNALSDSDRQAVESYLKGKYGL